MENQANNSVTQLISEPVSEADQSVMSQVEQQPLPAGEAGKQSNFLVILLSILLVISVAISGFFAFQTQRLVAELKVKNEELIVNSSESTIEPVATQALEDDSTANWKTYSNKNLGFVFRYPEEWGVFQPQIEGGAFNLYIAPNQKINEISDMFKKYEGFGGGKFLTMSVVEVENTPIFNSSEFQSVSNSTVTVGSNMFNRYLINNIQDGPSYSAGDKIETVVFPTGGKYILLNLLDYQYKNIFDQILSTFKFTN